MYFKSTTNNFSCQQICILNEKGILNSGESTYESLSLMCTRPIEGPSYVDWEDYLMIELITFWMWLHIHCQTWFQQIETVQDKSECFHTLIMKCFDPTAVEGCKCF